MSESGLSRAEVLAGLLSAQNLPDLPARARTACTSLADKLRSPVRLGLFGLPGAGKREIVNALFNAEIARPDLALPTFELSNGSSAQSRALCSDGRRVAQEGYPGPELLDARPVFLQITTPSPRLQGCKLLFVAADASPGDMAAALRWAASRVDVSIWASRDWTELERDIWQAAPDGLRNHAVLALTGDAVRADALRAGAMQQDGFEAVLDTPLSGNGAQGAPADALARHLVETIREATAQDLLAAEAFLQRYAPGATCAPPPDDEPAAPEAPAHLPEAMDNARVPDPAAPDMSGEPPSEPQPQPLILTHPLADDLAPENKGDNEDGLPAVESADTATHRPDAGETREAQPPQTVPPAAEPRGSVRALGDAGAGNRSAREPAGIDAEALRLLSRIFLQVRHTAEALRCSLAEAGSDAEAGPFLTQLEELFEDIAFRVEDADLLEDAWPDLSAAILEARDLSLLLRIEGGAAQLEDAAMLLLQLREEMEWKLAA